MAQAASPAAAPAETNHEVHQPAGDRIPALDGVRGFAALIVLFWHCVPSAAKAEPGSPLAYLAKAGGLGWSGVDLFFVLSGFLIGRILLQHRTATNLLPAFYLRRACRILPLYFIVIAAYGLMWALWPAGSGRDHLVANPFPLWAYPVFLQNIMMTAADQFGPPILSASWSLAVEEQFYLVAPLLFAVLPPKMLPKVLGILFVGAALTRPWLGGMGGYTLLWARADCLAAGCLLACWIERGGLAWLRVRPQIALLLGMIFLAGGMAYVSQGRGLSTVMTGWGRLNLTWIAAAYALLIASVMAWPSGLLARGFAQPFLRRAGVLSYGIYLVHEPILHVWFELIRSSPPVLRQLRDLWLLVPVLLLVWGAAEFLHRTVERPFLRLGHRLNYDR